jgi:hypothetical protein
MSGVVAKALKSAGLVPAMGAILVHLIKSAGVDPLQGYRGVAVHYWALSLCAGGWFAANRIYVWRPNTANLARPISSGLALALSVITAFLVLVELPESYTSLGEARWATALITYLAFYLALGVAFA